MTKSYLPNIYADIINKPGKKISVLIDPDKHSEKSLVDLIKTADKAHIDFFTVGGSLLMNPIDKTIDTIKKISKTPLVLFPGNLLQFSKNADAILLLSLISGRNPEFLIGNHVIIAPILKESGIEAIPTGYMIIGTGKTTSVEYISNTKPIPTDKTDIAVATAIAGELLGLKLIYLDAGSGADKPVPEKMIEQVKKNINIPLIVGGGLRSEESVNNACKNGADIIIIGNMLEKKPELISAFSDIVHNYK
jgi:putative glycerol-1-phosphate prenyltransferase